MVETTALKTINNGDKCKGIIILEELAAILSAIYAIHGKNRMLSKVKNQSYPNFSRKSLLKNTECSAFDYRKINQFETLMKHQKMCAGDDSQKMTVCLKDTPSNEGNVECLETGLIQPMKICQKFKDSLKSGACELEKTVFPKYVCRGDSFEHQGKEYCTDKEIVPVVAYCNQYQNNENSSFCNQEKYFLGWEISKFNAQMMVLGNSVIMRTRR